VLPLCLRALCGSSRSSRDLEVTLPASPALIARIASLRLTAFPGGSRLFLRATAKPFEPQRTRRHRGNTEVFRAIQLHSPRARTNSLDLPLRTPLIQAVSLCSLCSLWFKIQFLLSDPSLLPRKAVSRAASQSNCSAKRSPRLCRHPSVLPLCLRASVVQAVLQAISKITLPASPALIARIASSAASRGNRCVMTGVGSNWPDRRKRVINSHVSYIRRPTTP
jgi:hypothetical protein